MEELDRRQFMRGGAAAAALLLTPSLHKSEAAERSFELFASDLSPEELEAQKEAAVASLADNIPPLPELDYLREYIAHLDDESQMYIPSREELENVVAKSTPQLKELSAQLKQGEFGLFVFADTDEQRALVQRLYVLQKGADDGTQFVKAYPVSLAAEGFGNKKGSEKTPLGLHTIHSGKMGLFGEVVSGLNKYRHLFNHVKYGGEDHWFVKGFGTEEGNDLAEVVTDQYLLQGPETDVSRGIRIHGTNRSGDIKTDGTWQTFLGGKRRSGGCLRMSNTDIRDLGLLGFIKIGTVIMIHSTESAQRAPIKGDLWRPRPRRWNE